MRAGAVGRLDVGWPRRCCSGRVRGRALGGAAGVMDSATGVVGGKRLGVGSGCGDRLTGGAARHRTCRAGAVSAAADDRSRHVGFGRALAAGMRPGAVDVLLSDAGGRARRVESAGLWSRSARACVGGTTVEALRPAVTGVVADGGADAGAAVVRRLRSGGGSTGATHALRSTRAA